MAKLKETARKTGGKRPPHRPADNPPARKKTRTTGKGKGKKAPPPPDTEEDDYNNIKDPAEVEYPVEEYIHHKLKDGWTIEKENPMWFIFDRHSPARHFKRGVRFNPKAEFPAYSAPPYEDLTESDGGLNMLMPFAPWAVKKKYLLKCEITAETFMSWEQDEVRKISVGHTTRSVKNGRTVSEDLYVEREVPAPYDRIIAQLIAEDDQAEEDHGHEAVRRHSYARRVLNSFYEEILSYDDEAALFRSKVLTPLLQRQIVGVEDNYGPSVMQTVSEYQGIPTIEQATKFYLRHDPCHPRTIPNFRRTIIHIPEARWHLGVVLGHHLVGDPNAYNKNLPYQDVFKKYAEEQRKAGNKDVNNDTSYDDESGDDDEGEIPPESIPLFNYAEVRVIVELHLEEFFAPELERVPELLKTHLARRLERPTTRATASTSQQVLSSGGNCPIPSAEV